MPHTFGMIHTHTNTHGQHNTQHPNMLHKHKVITKYQTKATSTKHTHTHRKHNTSPKYRPTTSLGGAKSFSVEYCASNIDIIRDIIIVIKLHLIFYLISMIIYSPEKICSWDFFGCPPGVRDSPATKDVKSTKVHFGQICQWDRVYVPRLYYSIITLF